MLVRGRVIRVGCYCGWTYATKSGTSLAFSAVATGNELRGSC